MLTKLNEFFIKTVKLSPDIWMFILLGVVGVAFLVTLIVGLLCGDFKKIKSLMKNAAASPSGAVSIIQQMPVAVKKQYKRARVTHADPSAMLTEDICVDAPYKRSLISKIWLVTLLATCICAALAAVIAPLSVTATVIDAVETGAELDEAALANAQLLLPVMIIACGGFLTLVGAIIGKLVCSGAHKTYEKFVNAIDGSKGDTATVDGGMVYDSTSEPQPTSHVYDDAAAEPVSDDSNDFYATADAEPMSAEPVMDNEPVVEPYSADSFGEPYTEPVSAAEPVMDEEPVVMAEEPVMSAEPVFDTQPVTEEPVVMAEEPVVMAEPQESDEEIRRRAREEAIARMRAEQEAQAAADAAAQAAAQAAAAQAAAAQAQAQAAAAAQAATAQPQPQPAPAAAPAGSNSADDIIARIEQIDREGAPRETMREVATLLQKERAKPENKTPEQQKKLNEALSKLLKAMSAATRK